MHPELLRCGADTLRLLVRSGCRLRLAPAGTPATPCAAMHAAHAGGSALLSPAPRLMCRAGAAGLQVMVLRERSIWHPTYSPLRLRRAVVHVLAAGAQSAAQLPHAHWHRERATSCSPPWPLWCFLEPDCHCRFSAATVPIAHCHCCAIAASLLHVLPLLPLPLVQGVVVTARWLTSCRTSWHTALTLTRWVCGLPIGVWVDGAIQLITLPLFTLPPWLCRLLPSAGAHAHHADSAAPPLAVAAFLPCPPSPARC